MDEGEISAPWEIRAGVTQGSVLSPTLYSLYINDPPETPAVHLVLCTDYVYVCVCHKEACNIGTGEATHIGGITAPIFSSGP